MVGLDVGNLQQCGQLVRVTDGLDNIRDIDDVGVRDSGLRCADASDDGAHLGDTIQLALVIVGLGDGCELVTIAGVEEGRTINLGHTNDELCHFESPRGVWVCRQHCAVDGRTIRWRFEPCKH